MALRDAGKSAGKTGGGEFAAGPGAVEVEIARAGLNVKSLASVDTQLI
jgi:hypothetical protein